MFQSEGVIYIREQHRVQCFYIHFRKLLCQTSYQQKSRFKGSLFGLLFENEESKINISHKC